MDGKELSCELEFRKFHTVVVMGIFAMNLADGWTDRMDDGHTDRWTELHVESH